MKTHRLVFVSLIASFLSFVAMADEKSLSEGLRDALYLEEVKRDPAAAASAYESLLVDYDQKQQLAASALFRLAEIRRAQGRKDEAVALYQRLITEFPRAEAETNRAKENLEVLGVKQPVVAAVPLDKEEQELQHLKKLRETSPDLINHKNLESAVYNDYFRIVEWLIKDVKITDRDKNCVIKAAFNGNVKMTEFLIQLLGASVKEQFPKAFEIACSEGYLEVVRTLIKAGAPVNKVDGPADVPEYKKIEMQLFSGPKTSCCFC